MTNGVMVMTGTHDVRLVVLSIVIAVIASYAALDLAGRVTVAQGRARKLWLVGGAIAMGVGIWSMHFIAMLAYNLPIPIAYNFSIVSISMAVAVVASGAALFVVSRQEMGTLALLAGGIFMGLAIAAMHYTGMVAMRLEAVAQYNPELVALSIAIAIGASFIALWLAFRLRTTTTAVGGIQKIGSAIVLGNAIAGMHYTAMAAASFQPNHQLEVQPFHAVNHSLLAVGIGIATLVILALALLTSLFDRRIGIETARAEALRQSEERFRSLVQNSSDIIAVVSADGTVGYKSPSTKRILGYELGNWQKVFEFVHPDDLVRAENLLARALSCAGVNISDELRLQHVDGRVLSFEVIANNLLAETGVAGIVTTYRDITERKQVEAVLGQQAERERLIAEIAQRIRQSLNLKETLSTTVSEVRQFLQAERVFIYRFEPDWSGIVAVESVDSGWSSILGTKIKDTFFEASSNQELYKQGRIQAIEDIHTGEISQCHVDLLAQLQVRANLVVPIVQSGSVSGLSAEQTRTSNLKSQDSKLWGLLIANQCSKPRQWQQLEINLLKQLATQVAIAIQQSTLFEQAQTELIERKRAEQEVRLLQDVTQSVTEAQDFNSALEVTLRKVCKATKWDFGEAWTPCPDRAAVECAPACYGRNSQLENFRTMSEQLTFPPAVGLPGRVWASKQPEWIQDVSLQSDNVFLRAPMALKAGLKAGLGVPIIGNDQIVAILVFFMFESREEDQRLVDLVSAIATQLGSAIQRKQAEAALRESEEKFRSLVEQTNDWIWRIDGNGVFTYVNPQVREIVGYEPAEILGKTTFDLMAADEVRRFAELLEFFVSVQQPFIRLEKTLTHKDGHPVVLETSGSPVFDSQGVFQGYRGIARDITERKRIEQAIDNLNEDLQHRAAELEVANRELEAFSYSVSHDLRAPLRAMNGFSGILISEYAPQFPPEAKRYLQMVRDNAQQMGQLIDDLLRFSRLSRSSLKKQPVTPANLVDQAITDLYPEQQDRQVEMVINDLPTCQADPALLKQVWVNLLANALKFTRQQQVAHIQVGCQQLGELVYFVKDNGVGFDINYADKLFGVFQRLHRAEEYEGTGVGLAIVQRIIHRHGGRIWAEAEVNKGAAFYFTLGADNHHDRDGSRNSVSGRQSERRGINPPLLEKQ